ncbi:ABC transporter substrate-binding protein [Streptomyces sp. NPDC003247]|uniref:ABC transporter substrate-binding protein n=1 Tax=Streptomyces sp. NPDC003247 TaxID=3364677 RepID=UPI0036A3762B
MRRKLAFPSAAAGVLALVLSGCGGSGSDESSDGVVHLTYYAWGDANKKIVDAWNKTHPKIQVKQIAPTGNSSVPAKLLTQHRAGNSGPDMASVEYQSLPAVVTSGVAIDITKHIDSELKSDFTDSMWNLTTYDGKTFAVPNDAGPQVLLYNTKRFEELGVEVPTTWAEYAEAAKKIHEKDPDSYIATFNPTEFGNFAGLAQQAGAAMWATEGDTWKVGIDSEPALKVADYWQGLIDKGYVKVEGIQTPQWNQELNQGKILTWPSAIWAPSVIEADAPDTAGQWAMAKLPTWTEGDDKVGFQGGSSTIVTADSKHPEQAAEFIKWLSTSKEARRIGIAAGTYPGNISGQELAATAEPPTLMPQQTDFWKLAAEIAGDTLPAIQWGPNTDVGQSAYQDETAKAMKNGSTLSSAVKAVQDTVVSDMKKTGFKVSE